MCSGVKCLLAKTWSIVQQCVRFEQFNRALNGNESSEYAGVWILENCAIRQTGLADAKSFSLTFFRRCWERRFVFLPFLLASLQCLRPTLSFNWLYLYCSLRCYHSDYGVGLDGGSIGRLGVVIIFTGSTIFISLVLVFFDVWYRYHLLIFTRISNERCAYFSF